jgi:phage gp36-like protein
MPYATTQDIIDSYGTELLSVIADFDDDENIDTNAVDLAISRADNIINSHVAAQYDLPLAEPSPDILKQFSMDIAVYFLGRDGIGAVDERRERYKDAVAHLRLIGKGEAKLGIETEEESTPSGGDLEINSDAQVFSRDELGDF